MPVAGRGIYTGDKTHILHERLGLPLETKIAVYFGSVEAKWSGIHALLDCVANWPEDWILLLHHRYGTDTILSLLKNLDERSARKIRLSPFPGLPPNELHRLLHACDVGLCFYKPDYKSLLTGKNLVTIGMASGKFTSYMQHGLPVLAYEKGQIGDLISQHDLGWVIHDISDSKNILSAIDRKELKTKSKKCLDFFTEFCDLNFTGVTLLNEVEKIFQRKMSVKNSLNITPVFFDELLVHLRLIAAEGNIAAFQNSLDSIDICNIKDVNYSVLYALALELRKEGQPDLACAVYCKLVNEHNIEKSLAAWASFKHGEAHLDAGNAESANSMFRKALELNPNHVKARIYLVAPAESLRVCLGETDMEDLIAVPMDPLDEELWEYYFARRQPDFVRICLNARDFTKEASKIEEIARRHLASGGELEIIGKASLNV